MTHFYYQKSVTEKAQKQFRVVPEFMTKRIEEELLQLEANETENNTIQKGSYWRGCSLLNSLLEKKMNKDAYVVDYGTNGNLLIGYLFGLSEIIPVHPFYYCHKCGYHEVAPIDLITGYSLPKKPCPKCEIEMKRQGVNIPISKNSFMKDAAVGLKISRTFLKKNHLDIADSFKKKMDRRGRQAFEIKVDYATIKFEESHEATIIEKIRRESHIDVTDIDYNDDKVYQKIFGDDKYGLGMVATNLFNKTKHLLGCIPETFDDFIRIMGFYLGPASNIYLIEKCAKKYSGLDLNTIPTNREDLNSTLYKLGIDNMDRCTVGNKEITQLKTVCRQKPDCTCLHQLIDYLKASLYFEKKCTIIIKSLLIYRLAYLKTYFPEKLSETINGLGYSQVNQEDLKRTINRARLIARINKDELNQEKLFDEVCRQFKWYVSKDDIRFVDKYNQIVKTDEKRGQ